MLSRFLFPSGHRGRRPPSLLHGRDDRPPSGTILLLSLQHAVLALTLVAYVLVAANMAGLDHDTTTTLVSGSILAMGLGTIFQALGGRLGSGLFIVHITDPFMLTVAAFAMKTMGPAGVVLVTMTDGLTQIFISRVFPRLRRLFPPPVVGVVICLGGFGLVESAFGNSLGLGGGGGAPSSRAPDLGALVISALTLGTIMGCSIWGSPRVRLFGLIAGVAVGVVTSLATDWGMDHGRISEAAWFGLPNLILPTAAPDLSLLLPVVLVVALACLDTLGITVLMDKMDTADWRRMDARQVSRGLRATGLTHLICAPFGALSAGPSSANVGLCQLSRISARIVGLATGLLIATVAFIPVATTVLTTLPLPVLGAIQVYAAAYLITSGMEMICARALDGRGIVMVGTAMVVGMVGILVPQAATALPSGLRVLGESAMASGGLAAILLHQLLRLGTRDRVSLSLTPEEAINTRHLGALVERQCAHWAARRAVARTAALAVMEAGEVLVATGRTPLRLEGSFEETVLTLTLVHQGAPLPLKAAPSATALDRTLDRALEGDEQAFTASLAALPSVLLTQLATETRAGRTRDGLAQLTLTFDH